MVPRYMFTHCGVVFVMLHKERRLGDNKKRREEKNYIFLTVKNNSQCSINKIIKFSIFLERILMSFYFNRYLTIQLKQAHNITILFIHPLNILCAAHFIMFFNC